MRKFLRVAFNLITSRRYRPSTVAHAFGTCTVPGPGTSIA